MSDHETLLGTEEVYRTAFDNAPIGMAVVGPEGRYLKANRALCEMLGYSEEELLATTFQGITHPEDLEASSANARSAVEGEIASYSIEKRYFHARGHVIWVLLSVSLVRDGQGRPLYFVDQIQDITRRKADEEELTRRAKEMVRVNAELEQFAYSVSHDLRAPLRSINGFSRMLLEDHAESLDEQGKDYLGRVQAASRHMGQLIDDLLDLSYVSRGALRREPVDLSSLAGEIAAELREDDPGRRVEFVVAQGLSASGDPRLLRIALGNLLGNAWKFTQKKAEARIEFGATPGGDETTYFVRDDGAGFDMAYASKLFGTFQRFHDPEEFEGTGIGLATVQRIIHRHGGEVWAEGAVGQGAKFCFTLAGGD